MYKLIIAVLLSSFAFVSYATQPETEYYNENHGDLVLLLVGTGEAYHRKVPGLRDEATCFDLDLIDLSNNMPIGKATDCISDVEISESGTVKVVGTTFFKLPKGKIISRGNITLQPVEFLTETIDGVNATHITGAATSDSNIIKGRKLYRNATGNVRLSGAVDMSQFTGNVGDPVTFSCIFVISDIRLDN